MCVHARVVSFWLKGLHTGALEPRNKPVELEDGHCLAEGQTQVGVSSQRVSEAVPCPVPQLVGADLLGFCSSKGRELFSTSDYAT